MGTGQRQIAIEYSKNGSPYINAAMANCFQASSGQIKLNKVNKNY